MKKIEIKRYVEKEDTLPLPGWKQGIDGMVQRQAIDIPLNSLIEITLKGRTTSILVMDNKIHMYTDGVFLIEPVGEAELLIKTKRC